MKFSCMCVDACTNIYFFGEICHTLLNLLNVTFHNHNLKCLQVWNIFCCDVNTPLYMQTTNKVAHEKMAYVVMVDFICIFASVFVVCQENTLDWKLLVNAEQHQKSLPNYLVVVFFSIQRSHSIWKINITTSYPVNYTHAQHQSLKCYLL